MGFIPATGFTFSPTDEQLIDYYLKNKIAGIPTPYEIKECDLYGSQEPWEIWRLLHDGEDDDNEDLYVFTKLKKMTAKSTSRILRKVGSGSGVWKGEDSAKQIGEIGSKKRFVYKNEDCEEHDKAWNMTEYSINNSSDSDYVLCRIRKNQLGCSLAGLKRRLLQQQQQQGSFKRFKVQRKQSNINKESEEQVSMMLPWIQEHKNVEESETEYWVQEHKSHVEESEADNWVQEYKSYVEFEADNWVQEHKSCVSELVAKLGDYYYDHQPFEEDLDDILIDVDGYCCWENMPVELIDYELEESEAVAATLADNDDGDHLTKTESQDQADGNI